MPVNLDEGVTSPIFRDPVVISRAGDNRTSSHSDKNRDQEQHERDAATEKRYRRKSLRRQLQDVIDQLGEASNDPHQKPAKRIDALLRQSEVLLRLQAMDAEDRDQTLQDEHAALTAQHAADTERIATLQAQNDSLKSHKCEIVTRVTPDPEHLRIRAERDTLNAGVKFLAGVVANKEQTAILAIQQLPAEAATLVCEAVGINYREYRQYLNSHRSERDLLGVIEKAQVDDTPLLRFVRAALAVNHSLNVVPEPRRADPDISLSAEDKLRAAKQLTKTSRVPVVGDYRPSVRTSSVGGAPSALDCGEF